MIDVTWIARKSLVRMLMAAARVARDSIAWSVHSLELVWFLALSITSCPITARHLDFVAAGARGRCLRGDALWRSV